jgi:hypothetical protein
MRLTTSAALLLSLLPCAVAKAELPVEPVEIGHLPQFVFDNYVVDNHWAIRYKRQAVERVFHPAEKHAANPILTGDQPSFVWVARDADAGLFRMYYQANFPVAGRADDNQETLPAAGNKPSPKGRAFATHIAYAESKDGVSWTRPDLGIFKWFTGRPNNIVIGFADHPEVESCGPCLLDVPERDRRGFRWLMLYRAKGKGSGDVSGIRIVGSHDGVHFDQASDTRIAHLHSDHHNTISYDPLREEYVMFCRGKHIYRAWGEEMLDTGASRRVARIASKQLWTDWLAGSARPQTILVPDEIDSASHFNFFYGMPSQYRDGVYWGFLEPFRMNDFIYTELATSRDGFHFQRLPGRPKLIEYGQTGSWDDEMIFASPAWVEVGDEWWIYYSGWDGPHGTAERTGGIGLAKIRKEGFVSMLGPAGGGVVCTRLLRWPGGPLLLNADAREGELRVRVSDAARKPLAGFNYDDCEAYRGDSVAHEVRWKGRSLDDFKGREIRLEIYLQDAHLYTFRAGE